jgi:arabinogalactan endo-1,4-beta-galactosidase
MNSPSRKFYKFIQGFGPLILSLFLFSFILFSCNPDEDDPDDPKPSTNDFFFGADLSSVNMVEFYGAFYKDSGMIRDPFILFKNHGCNLIRVRLFNNPDAKEGYGQYNRPGYCGLNDVSKTIRRAKEAGMEVCLDFHYSDTWADPGNQKIPLAWKGLTLNVMKDSLYNYTLSVLNYLKNKNLTPEMVQIGNEIDPGLLLPVGNTTTALAVLLNSGIKAIRDFSEASDIKPKIIIHYADNAGAVSRFQTLNTAGVTDFDIMGISYYDQWANINFTGLVSVIKQLKLKFKKEVMVVETAYQWTNTSRDGKIYNSQIQLNGYPVTQVGQYNYLKDLTQNVIASGGSGVIYWEPAWVNSSLGYGQEVNSFFDFNGNVLPGINFMSYAYDFN